MVLGHVFFLSLNGKLLASQIQFSSKYEFFFSVRQKIVRLHSSSQCLSSTFSTPNVVQGQKLQQKAAFFTLTELKVQKQVNISFYACLSGHERCQNFKSLEEIQKFLSRHDQVCYFNLSSEEQFLFTSIDSEIWKRREDKVHFFILFIHLNIQ